MIREQAIQFGNQGSLVGVITHAEGSERPGWGLLLLTSGIVHHVGINRIHVTLARRIAELGVPTLRFDLSGVGDSAFRRDDIPFVEGAVEETREAMTVLAAEAGVDRFVLAGLCSGAVIAFRTAQEDDRCSGVILINPIGHLHGDECHVPQEYMEGVRRRHFLRMATRSSFRSRIWIRLLTGGVDLAGALKTVSPAAVGHLLRSSSPTGPAPPSPVLDYRQLAERNVRILQIHAEGDEGLDYLYRRLGGQLGELEEIDGVSTQIIEGANHTFTLLWAQRRLIETVAAWATRVPIAVPASAGSEGSEDDRQTIR